MQWTLCLREEEASIRIPGGKKEPSFPSLVKPGKSGAAKGEVTIRFGRGGGHGTFIQPKRKGKLSREIRNSQKRCTAEKREVTATEEQRKRRGNSQDAVWERGTKKVLTGQHT